MTTGSLFPLQVFASCLPGLEPILLSELQSFGFSSILSEKGGEEEEEKEKEGIYHYPSKKPNEQDKEQEPEASPGGVSFQVHSLEQLFFCHLYIGSASHILLRCGDPFVATRLNDLVQHVSRMTFWKLYLNVIPFHESSKKILWNPSLLLFRNSNRQTLPILDIRVITSQSRLYHTKAIAERIEEGIWNALGFHGSHIVQQQLQQQQQQQVLLREKEEKQTTHPSSHELVESDPKVKILVRIVHDQVQISIDSSSTPLHKRGYKLETGKAPLREDVAFALLYTSGWRPRYTPHILWDTNDPKPAVDRSTTIQSTKRLYDQLVDPFCGAGTIVIEAASIAAGKPPGRLRSAPLSCSRLMIPEDPWSNFVTTALERIHETYSIREWYCYANSHPNKIKNAAKYHGEPTFREKTMNRMNMNMDMNMEMDASTNIVAMGSDRCRGAIDSAWNNATRAGVSEYVRFDHSSLRSNPWLFHLSKKRNSNKEKTSVPLTDIAENSDRYLVVTNPPFGHRISPVPQRTHPTSGTKEEGNTSTRRKKYIHPLLPLYQTLGHLVRSGNHPSTVLAENIHLARATGIRNLQLHFATRHGGMRVFALSCCKRVRH